MNYQKWMEAVPDQITGDLLWKVEAYRLALFAADLGWHDVTKLMQDQRTRGLASQLYEAIGSIGANISEGYSRGSGKDRARFYEYSLGSARESRTWYFNGRHVLGEAVVGHRMQLGVHLIRLLLVMVPDQRAMPAFHEEAINYCASSSESGITTLSETTQADFLFHPAPIP